MSPYEIDITTFFETECARDFSASVAEIGANAGTDTWRAAIEATEDYTFINDDNRDEWREFVRSSGGWTTDEINAMSDTELNALFIQWVAGDMREGGLDCESPDWEAYEADENRGTRIFRGSNNRIYFYIGI